MWSIKPHMFLEFNPYIIYEIRDNNDYVIKYTKRTIK